MTDHYTALLESNDVVKFTNRKYGVTKSAAEQRLVDPYYRFFRIINLLRTESVAPQQDDIWLDLGCHHGQFLSLMSQLHSARWAGVDDWDLKSAMPFTSFRYFPTDLAGDQWTREFEQHSVRFISALEVIEHITDTDQFLERIKGLLAPDGYLVLSTPNINSLRNRILVPLGVYPAYLEFRNVIHHVRLFNAAKLTELLGDHSLQLHRIIGVNFLPERLLRFSVLRRLSEVLADAFPTLCGGLIVLVRRKT